MMRVNRPHPFAPLAATAALVFAAACSSDESTSGSDETAPDLIDLSTQPPTTDTVSTEPSETATPTSETPMTEAPATEPPSTEPPATEPPSTEAPSTEAPATEPPSADGGDTDSVVEPRVGTWVVFEAGEIEIDLVDGGLALLDIRANDGWNVAIDEESGEEISVDFELGDVEIEFEAEYEGGVLEIEIDRDETLPDGGVVDVGQAGRVEFAWLEPGSSIELVGVTENEGWTFSVTEQRVDEIEVLIVNGRAEYEVDIEVDDGLIDVEVDFTVSGPFPT